MLTQRPIYPIIAYTVIWQGGTVPSVHVVTITRHGIPLDCKGVSVDVTYADGRKVTASPEMFFDTRLDALNKIDEDLGTAIHANVDARIALKKEYDVLVQQAIETCNAICREMNDD